MFAAIVGQSWATAAHPFNLEINGVDYVTSVQFPTIDIEMAGPGTNGSMTFTLEDPASSVTVAEWDEVRFIEHAATRPILFGGFVQSVRFVAWAAGGRSIAVTCVGYGILLDKKVVPSFDTGATNTIWAFDQRLVSMVNAFGGKIGALANSSGVAPAATSSIYSIPYYGNNWGIGFSIAIFSVPVNSTLRAAVEYTLSLGTWFDSATSTETPIGYSYWVDSACRLMAFPELPAAAASDSPSEWRTSFDGGVVPGIAVDALGTYALEAVAYEREDTDRATSAYVVGGSANGTGYYRAPGLERAGDLEIVVTDSSVTDASGIKAKGGAAVGITTAATAHGELSIQSITPLDIWTGRNIQITFSQVGLAGEDWRITSVGITFDNSTSRHYTIGFGGNQAPPSAMNRTGRFAIRT